MRTSIIALSAVALFSLGATIASAPPSLKFTSMGFSIAPIIATEDATEFIPLTMSLPATEDGFTPSVSVLIQPWEQTMEEYREQSIRQLKDAGWTVLGEGFTANTEGGTDDAKALVLEYEGGEGDALVHYYAKAKARRGNIVLATASASALAWKQHAVTLKTCVDSLTVDGARKPTTPPAAAKPAKP